MPTETLCATTDLVAFTVWMLTAKSIMRRSDPLWTSSISLAGQFPGERQRFRVLGVARTYTTSQSWVEVRYADLAHNAATVLSHLAPGSIPLAIVKGNAYGHGKLQAKISSQKKRRRPGALSRIVE